MVNTAGGEVYNDKKEGERPQYYRNVRRVHRSLGHCSGDSMAKMYVRKDALDRRTMRLIVKVCEECHVCKKFRKRDDNVMGTRQSFVADTRKDDKREISVGKMEKTRLSDVDAVMKAYELDNPGVKWLRCGVREISAGVLAGCVIKKGDNIKEGEYARVKCQKKDLDDGQGVTLG